MPRRKSKTRAKKWDYIVLRDKRGRFTGNQGDARWIEFRSKSHKVIESERLPDARESAELGSHFIASFTLDRRKSLVKDALRKAQVSKTINSLIRKLRGKGPLVINTLVTLQGGGKQRDKRTFSARSFDVRKIAKKYRFYALTSVILDLLRQVGAAWYNRPAKEISIVRVEITAIEGEN